MQAPAHIDLSHAAAGTYTINNSPASGTCTNFSNIGFHHYRPARSHHQLCRFTLLFFHRTASLKLAVPAAEVFVPPRRINNCLWWNIVKGRNKHARHLYRHLCDSPIRRLCPCSLLATECNNRSFRPSIFGQVPVNTNWNTSSNWKCG